MATAAERERQTARSGETREFRSTRAPRRRHVAMGIGIVVAILVLVWGAQKWCRPFVWMGMNPVTIYLVSEIIDGFDKLTPQLVGGDIKRFFDSHVSPGFGDLISSLVGLALAFWFVHFLYRRKIFIRL